MTVTAVPELPEVETVRRELQGTILAKRIESVKFHRPNLRYILPPEVPKLFKGLAFTKIARRGKYLLFETDGDYTLIGHLGMSGNFTFLPNLAGTNQELPHRHVDIVFADGSGLIYCDARRFGFIDFCAKDEVDLSRHFRGMGIEPLSDGFTGAYLHGRAKGSLRPIKNFLLDQNQIAGIGNIYACEALWLSGISPLRASAKVSKAKCDELVANIVSVLGVAIEAGGSSMRDFQGVSGDLGYFQHSWACYGREGERCSKAGCKGVIRRVVQSGRSSFYCARHQR